MIIVRTDVTPAFRTFHGMGPNQNGCGPSGCWPTNLALGQIYYREILAINGNQITLDIPVRYRLDPNPTTGNTARVYRTSPNTIYNVGIENVAIGMLQNNRAGENTTDLENPDTAAYNTTGAAAVRFVDVKDGWIKNVRSFQPNANTRPIHILSSGIVLQRSSRGISVIDCYMGFPQNRLAGGNGYLYILAGQEALVSDSVAEEGRHNFQFTGLSSSGNVILRGETIGGSLDNDFHTYLSHANLIDNQAVMGNLWTVVNRKTLSDGAGITGTQNVFWNLFKLGSTSGLGANPFVTSAQFGYGYVIGTVGLTASVSNPTTGAGDGTAPADWVEGINFGDTLSPTSLYLDQKARRDASLAY